MHRIQKIIKEFQRKLTWKILQGQSVTESFHIVSSPHHQTHTIYWPTSGGQPREIEYLHELCHAYLAENVHPQFSAQYFKRGTPERAIRQMVPICQAASDWFADELLFSLAPQETQREVEEHLNYVHIMLFQVHNGLSPFLVFSSALILAQGQRYLGLHSDTFLQPLISVFLSIEPKQPTVNKLADLINGLSRLTLRQQIRLTVDAGVDVWEITPNMLEDEKR